MTTSVHTIAKLIIHNSERISNLKLQKLLYYVQGWHLGLRGTPVFTERIEAWVHGPVVPDVFQEYRDFKWSPITIPSSPFIVNINVKNHTLAVLKEYGSWTASQLEAQSHEESPWKEARKGLLPTASSNKEITHASMQRYFSARVNG